MVCCLTPETRVRASAIPPRLQPADTDREWRRLARMILEQALWDARFYCRQAKRAAGVERPDPFPAVLEPCREELMAFLSGDWCAMLCDMSSLGYERYVSGALRIMGAT